MHIQMVHLYQLYVLLRNSLSVKVLMVEVSKRQKRKEKKSSHLGVPFSAVLFGHNI